MSEGYKTETWTFRGYHYNGQKLFTIWIDGDGKELVYARDKTTEAVIGFRYEIEVNRGSIIRAKFGAKKWLNDQPPSTETAQWRLESRDAEAQDSATKLHAKMMKENGNIGALTLDEVRDMMRKRRGYKNRQGLIAALLDYIET